MVIATLVILLKTEKLRPKWLQEQPLLLHKLKESAFASLASPKNKLLLLNVLPVLTVQQPAQKQLMGSSLFLPV